jgi:serine/threonine protein kinase
VGYIFFNVFPSQIQKKLFRLKTINYFIIFRDLKPENILFDTHHSDGMLKIIDFGTSALIDPDTLLSQKFGTVIKIREYFIVETL